ncbi:MAG: hypothetical protein K0S53_1926 [Bacteroidetes bacterium]|jgi:hypothetical protein|nr:hypothetical protein [Bacteroidota bacterium]
MGIKRKQFDEYLWQCYLDFLDVEGDVASSKSFVAYRQALNRNPKQVPDLLWKILVKRNIKRHNHN